MKQEKGRQFERQVARDLSLWWTGGKRDDVFWRTAGSGARATVRAKKGVDTQGSFGDIGWIDPEGVPLISSCVIELKRGSSYDTPWDVVEKRSSKSFYKTLLQVLEEKEKSKRKGWMIIAQRDRKMAMIYIDLDFFDRYFFNSALPECFCVFHFKVGKKRYNFATLRFTDFLNLYSPAKLKNK